MPEATAHFSPAPRDERLHPRTVGWFGTTSVAMGGINQSLFLLGALFVGQGAIPGQGSAAVVLLGVGLILAWMATPGWTELILMYPNRVGGIAATCAEAFRPYSPVLSNLTGVCYWWGWVPTCGLTALLASSAITQWYGLDVPVPLLATVIVVAFTAVNLCGVKWVMRFAMPIATLSALLAFASAAIPVFSGQVNWQQSFTFHLTVPFDGWFGELTSIMAGLYLIGFAAPAFEQAACHVGETRDPNKNVPRAMLASAALASLYFIVLPLVWLGTLGPEPLGKELALELGPTFAPLVGAGAKAIAIWFMIFNMLHGTLAPLAGASRTLAQLSEDGLLPKALAKRSRTDTPWVATLLTAGMSIIFLAIGDPVWLIAAANLTYLIGIALPSVAVWLLRRNEPELARPYRAPRGTIALGLLAATVWGLTVVLGFQQFGLPTVLVGIVFAYSGSVLYAWRKFSDRRELGLPGIAKTLHLKLTGAMLLVLVLDAAGYLVAVDHVPNQSLALIAMLEDIFVAVALLTIAVGLVLPGMIAHSAVQVSQAADKLVEGTLADFTRAMRALAAGDLHGAKARIDLVPVKVYSHDEVGDMAHNFNRLQDGIAQAAHGLDGARDGLSQARALVTDVNLQLSQALQTAAATLKELEGQKQALVHSLLEKDALLKEVHHRVKNNLQVISSLLRLESVRIEHPVTKAVLGDMQGRIRSMSLLHEAIYSHGNFADVDLAQYLSQIVTQLLRLSSRQPNQVGLNLEVESIRVGMDQAILCGMIVNELVSNCLKHAFVQGEPGVITLLLAHLPGTHEVMIQVRDNGVGLKGGGGSTVDVALDASLGLQLVSDLCLQLRGKLVVSSLADTVFTVTFTPIVPERVLAQ
jgi:two-component sensor histidine kinase/amino acid transporter